MACVCSYADHSRSAHSRTIDISLHTGRFWARSTASFRLCEVVGSQVAMDGVQPRDIRGRAGAGLFQLSGGGAVRIISITIAHNIYFFLPHH